METKSITTKTEINIININNRAIIAFGELAQTLLSYKAKKTDNANETFVFGIDQEQPFLAVDTRPISVATRETQAKLSIAESGTQANFTFAYNLGKENVQKILNYSISLKKGETKPIDRDVLILAIAIGGGSHAVSFAVAEEAKRLGKKVFFIVFDLFDIDDSDRAENAKFAKAKLKEYSHTFVGRDLSFKNENIFEDICNEVSGAANNIVELFENGSIDQADASKAVNTDSEFFISRESDNEVIKKQVQDFLMKSQNGKKIQRFYGSKIGFKGTLELFQVASSLSPNFDSGIQKKVGGNATKGNIIFVSL